MGIMPMGLLLALLAMAGGVWGHDESDPKNTIALNEDNFVQVKEMTWMIMFWAPWCGHCRRVKPLFAEASEKAKEGVKMGMVDCTAPEGKPVCESVGVSSYPTFKYAISGTGLMKYDGPRTTDDFVRFINRLGNSSLHVLEFNSADLKELEKRDDVNVFIFCTPDGKPTDQITWVARRGLTYGRSYYGTHKSDSELCGGRNTAFLINDIGLTEITPEKGAVEECLEDDLDSARLKSVLEWVSKHKHLAVDRIDQSMFHHLARSDKPYLFMLISSDGDWAQQRPFLNVLRKVINKPYADSFSFGWLDGSSYGEWVADLLSLDDLPTVVVYHLEDESSFTSEESKIAVHHAYAQGSDADGAMQATVEDMIEGVVTGRYQVSYQGPAGFVLGASQKFFPFLLPYLKELRRSAQSDVLFLVLVVVILTLLVTILANFVQIMLGGGYQPMPQVPQHVPRSPANHQGQGPSDHKKKD